MYYCKPIIFLCLSSTIYGQIHQLGTCNLKAEDLVDFDIIGDWYQLKRINETNSVDGNCLSLNFSLNVTTGETRFTTTSVSNKQKVSRNASVVMTSQKNILHIVYTDNIEYDMVVQKTDNKNYFIVHGCKANSLPNTKSVYGQVYTRTIPVSDGVKAIINNALKANTDFADATWFDLSYSTEACHTDSGMSLQISSFLLLVIGLVLAKDM